MSLKIYLLSIVLVGVYQPTNMVAQEYIVGGDFDYAPFSFIDKTGKPNGLDIEVLKEVSLIGNIKLKYKLSEWDTALSYIQSGDTDIVVGIIYSEEREEYLDFTTPIHTEYYSIFIRKDLPLDDLSRLYEYKLAVLDMDISIEKYLIPMGLFKDYVLVKSLPEALSALEMGLADYVVAPNLLGLNEIEKRKYQNIEIKGPPIIPSIYSFAVKKGNTELLNILNAGIAELRKNGKLTEIQKKWKIYESDDYRYKQLSQNIGSIIVLVVLLLILGIIWVWSLRSQISKKTESLHQKNIELQKSEEKFRVLTENSSDIIWHLDSNFKLTYISPADERIRGFKKEEILGNSLFSILKPEGIELIKEANKKRMIELSEGVKSAPVIYELEELCKDGSWIWVEATATAFFDENGNITGYHGVSRDISERKRAELLLKEREIQLQELITTKDKLFSIIAHDLRSPFNAILGLSELLIESTNNSEVDQPEEYLKLINTSARNTLSLLDNLLAWARSQTGKNTYSPVKTNLNAVIDEILQVSKSIAKIKNITINYNHTDEVEVYADVNMLKTILRNLISNAIKYTHTNGEIVISATQEDKNILISVSDNGVGMNEETRAKLFDVYTNITTTGTANEKGSGLGLVICKEFVDQHDGEIRVQSEPGNGSTFTVSLPLR